MMRFLTATKISLLAATDGFALFSYQNGTLERLFGEGRPYYGGNGISMRESQGRYLFSYHSSTTARHNIALYDHGSFTRVLQE